MTPEQLMAQATQSARDQLAVAHESVTNHLDEADRIHQRVASETLTRIAELQAVANVAKELAANPT